MRTPRSLRACAACFIAGWNVGANRNATPTSLRHCSTIAGAAWMLTPSASSTSALPHWLDTDRLPCLAIRMPHAARTIADAVEMLKVPDRSPPVPQVSNTAPGGGVIGDRIRAHGLREADELGRPLAFHAEADEQPGDLRLRRFALHDGGHRRGRFRGRQVFLVAKLFDEGWEHDHISRKLRRMRRPSLVSTDSGWNCTP